MGGYNFNSGFCDRESHVLEAYVVDTDYNVIERCSVCGWQYFHLVDNTNENSPKPTFLDKE